MSSETPPRPPETPPSPPEAPPTFVAELLRRRLPYIGLAYLGGAWTFFQFVQWGVRRYGLATAWEDATLFGLLLLLPSVLLLAYRHGAPGRQRLRRMDLFLPAANVLVVVALGGLLLGRVPDEASLVGAALEGAPEEAALPPQVGVFAFDNVSGEADLDWLRTGVPVLLQTDLNQDPGVGLFTVLQVVEHVRRTGVTDVHRVPLTVQRAIAQALATGYVLGGTVDRVGEVYTLAYDLHDVATSRSVARRTAAGADLYALVDSLTVALKDDLGLSDRADVADLPVAEVASPSMEAVRAFVRAYHVQRVDHDYEAADALVSDAVRLDPAFASAHLYQFSLKRGLQQEAESVAALRAAQQHRYRLNRRQQFTANYVQLFIDQKPDEALAVLEQWNAYDPNDPTALEYLYSLRHSRDETDEAIRLLRRLIDVSPLHRQRLSTLGALLRDEGRYDEARVAYEAYLDAFPHETQGHLDIGYLDAATGRWDEALVAYRQAVAADPNHFRPYAYLLDAYTRLGRLDDASEAAEPALARARTTADSISVLSVQATFHARRGRLDDVRRAYERQWALERRRVHASDVLHSQILAANVFAELGAVDEAQALVDAVQADPSVAAATEFRRHDLAWHGVQAKIAAGDAAAARGAFDAFMVQMETIQAAYGLDRFEEWQKEQGRLHLLEGDAAAAIAILTRYAEETPLDYETWRLLADAHRLAGDRRAAETHYRHVLRLYPAEPHAHLGLARLFDAAGRRAEAREHLDRALAAWRDADATHPAAAEARAFAARLSA